MQSSRSKSSSRKYLRTQFYRRWTPQEELQLIQYLIDNRISYQKPIPQAYYKRFIKETNLDMEWTTVKDKIRYIRMRFKKGRQIVKQAKPDEEIDWDQVPNISTLYKQLEEVFNDWDSINTDLGSEFDKCTDTSTSMGKQNIHENSCSPSNEVNDGFVPFNTNTDNNTNVESIKEVTVAKQESVPCESLTLPTKPQTSDTIENRFNKDALTMEQDISQRQQRRNALLQRNWEIEKYLMEHQLKCDMLEFEKEKLLFERERFNKELQLQVREMQWKRELNDADLEMKERIAMRELEIKENVVLKELPTLDF